MNISDNHIPDDRAVRAAIKHNSPVRAGGASSTQAQASHLAVRARAGALVATFLLALALHFSPAGERFSSDLSSIAQLTGAVVGAIACLLASRRIAGVRDRARRQIWAWQFIAASLLCFATGHAVSQGAGLPQAEFSNLGAPKWWLPGEPRFGLWWLAQYGLLWLGLLLLAWPDAAAGAEETEGENGERRSITRLVIDHSIVVLAVLVVLWTTVLEPRLALGLTDTSLAQSPLGLKSLAALFPASVVGHLFCALMLLSASTERLRGRRGRRTLALLAGAVLLLLASDSAYAIAMLSGTYWPGEVLDAGWPGAWLLLGAAALSDSEYALYTAFQARSALQAPLQNPLQEREEEASGSAVSALSLRASALRERRRVLEQFATRHGWVRGAKSRREIEIWVPYAAALGACGVLVAREAVLHSSALERITPILGLVVIVIGRQMLTLADNVRLSRRLRRANRDLEQNVNDRTRYLATLHGITSTLNSSLDDRAILHGILDGILPAVRAQAGGIWLRDARRFSSTRALSPQIRRAPDSPAASTYSATNGDSAIADSTLSTFAIAVKDSATVGGTSATIGSDSTAASTYSGAELSAGAHGTSIDWGSEWSPAYTKGFENDALGAVALRDRAIIAAITDRRAAGSNAKLQPPAGGQTLPSDKSLIMLPIRWQGLLLGAIGLMRREGEFSYEERALVESVALEAGTALQNARLYQQANRRADRDPVTELFNHRAMQQSLHSRLLKASGRGESLAVVMMDMNNFKFFNDTYGHLSGDDVLRAVARALSSACRASDVVGRYGGDEFIALLPQTDAQGARDACARIAGELDRHHFEAEPGSRVPITMSFGWAVYPDDGQTPLELTNKADSRLFENKRNGPASFLWSLPLWQGEALGSRAPLSRRKGDRAHADQAGASASDSGASAHSRRSERAASTCSTSNAASALGVGDAIVSGATAGIFGGSFDVLDALVTAIDNKDRYTRRHSEEVTQLALMTARELGFSTDLLRAIRISGLLHDVGKIAVPDLILRHPGKLGEEETRIMRQHPVFGALIVRDVAHQESVVAGVRHHHERWDGAGYPDGLRGEAIPWMGRLLAVGDVFSALTTDRPYRKALAPLEALAAIEAGAGTQFDPAFVAAFGRVLRRELKRLAQAAAARRA